MAHLPGAKMENKRLTNRNENRKTRYLVSWKRVMRPLEKSLPTATQTKKREREAPARVMGRPFVSFKKVTIQKQIPFWVPELKKVIKKRERKVLSVISLPIGLISNPPLFGGAEALWKKMKRKTIRTKKPNPM
jgi:hypothetical protein